MMLVADDDNTSLILILAYHFQQKKHEGAVFLKITLREVLELRYLYTVYEFVCSLSAGLNTGT